MISIFINNNKKNKTTIRHIWTINICWFWSFVEYGDSNNKYNSPLSSSFKAAWSNSNTFVEKKKIETKVYFRQMMNSIIHVQRVLSEVIDITNK